MPDSIPDPVSEGSDDALGDFPVHSGFDHNGAPLVTLGFSGRASLSTDEARQFAMVLIQCANRAETLAIIRHTLHTDTRWSEESIQRFLDAYLRHADQAIADGPGFPWRRPPSRDPGPW